MTEFECYTEAADEGRIEELNALRMKVIAGMAA
jgi:hypothetical protein